MKKILLLSIILLQSLIFKSLGATDNSLENPYKIVERKAPEKHFTVNKENLLQIFDLEPEKVIVEMELPYLNRSEKFELQKMNLRGEESFTFTTDGHYFSTKIYNGIAYTINDFNNINMGTMTIYPNNVNISLQINGQEIKLEKDFNSKLISISKNEINDKNTEDFKNIKDIISKIDKIKNEKTLTKSDISAMKEIKDFEKEKKKEKQQTIKEFKNNELLGPSPAPAPPRPPFCGPLSYYSCQTLRVNYMISYETYIKWQTPVFDFEDLSYPSDNFDEYSNDKIKTRKRLIIKDTALKRSYNRKAVLQCVTKLTNYFARVSSIFANEGINIRLGTIIVETNPWENQGSKTLEAEQYVLNYRDTELDFDISTFKNQYLDGNREWKYVGGGDARDGNFKDIPHDEYSYYIGGTSARTKPWSYGRLNTEGARDGIKGLMALVTARITQTKHANKEYKQSTIRDEYTRKSKGYSDFFASSPDTNEWDRIGLKRYAGAPINDTIVMPLYQAFDGLWFYIGDITPSTKNENPALTWKEFIKKDNNRAELIRYSGQNNGTSLGGTDNWQLKKGWAIFGGEVTRLEPGSFNHNNYLPMMVAPKDFSDDFKFNLPPSNIYGKYFDLSKSGYKGLGLKTRFEPYDNFDANECGCHLQPIGVTKPYLSFPNQIYGLPNDTKFTNSPDVGYIPNIGIIPLLGNMWYHTFDLENVRTLNAANTGYFDLSGGDLRNGDATIYKNYDQLIEFSRDSSVNNGVYYLDVPDTLLLWNYHDVENLFGTSGQFGNSNHLAYNIDKWNVWMLVHNIGITLGPRYFTTKENRNTILAPLARNYNYNPDDYDLGGGTPHIHERFKMKTNTEMNYSWFGYYYRNKYFGNSIGQSVGATAAPTGLGAILAGNSLLYGTTTLSFWNNFSVAGLSGGVSFGTLFAFAGAFYGAIILYQFISTAFDFGFKIEDLFSPKDNFVAPYIYRRHIEASNTAGDNYDRDNWGAKGNLYIGANNWNMEHSMWDLNLVEDMSPVDLVSFSKGFDKKTSDLIRLNLTNEFVNGHGPHVNNCQCGTNINGVQCYKADYLFFPGLNNPYAKIDLWNKDTLLLNEPIIETEYQFADDTIIARNGIGSINGEIKENLVIRKNNFLSTEQQINDWDNNTTLDNWYGKQMKPQFQDDSGMLVSNNSFDWRFNGSPTILTYPKSDRRSAVRFALPNTPNIDSNFRIYPLTLRLTDTNNCVSNTAVKYIRVYPKKQLPVRNTFIDQYIAEPNGPNKEIRTRMSDWLYNSSRIQFDQYDLNRKNLYGTRYTGVKNWEFVGPWSTGEGPSEASTWPSDGNNLGFYSRSMKPWSPSRLSNTGWGIVNKAVIHPAYDSQKFGINPNTTSFSTLHYFPARRTIESAIKQKENLATRDPSEEDRSAYYSFVDTENNYLLGGLPKTHVYFKNEVREEHKPYFTEDNYTQNDPIYKNWAFKIYDYYNKNQGSLNMYPNAKSPIKYFYGIRREFPTSQLIDEGVRQIYDFTDSYDVSSWLGLGNNPSRIGHRPSWFQERDYVFINRIRANSEYPFKFPNGVEWYRLRWKSQQFPYFIKSVDSDVQLYPISNPEARFENVVTYQTSYNTSSPYLFNKPENFISENLLGGLEGMKEHCSLTHYRKETDDIARSPLFFNNDKGNNILTFKLSYSSFSIDTAAQLRFRQTTGLFNWPVNYNEEYSLPYSINNPGGYLANDFNEDMLEIWLIAKDETYNPQNFIFPKSTKVKIFSKSIKEMSSYRDKANLFKFKRNGNPLTMYVGNEFKSSPIPTASNGYIRTIFPNYMLEPIVPEIGYIGPGIKTPIGTAGWFPAIPQVINRQGRDLIIWHQPQLEYLKSPIDNKYYKNTIDWNDINIDLREYDTYKSLQFEIVYKNKGDYNRLSSSLMLGSIEVESGSDLPLPLCEGGQPKIEFTSAVNNVLPPHQNSDPEMRVASWKLTSPIPNNVARYEVYKIRTDVDPVQKVLISQGTTGQAYVQNENVIKNCPQIGPIPNPYTCPGGNFVGPLLKADQTSTAIGATYVLEAHLINEQTTTLITNQTFDETTPQKIIISSPPTEQQRIPKRNVIVLPDSSFNFDGSFKLSARFNIFGSNFISNIERFTLQKATINTSGTSESDTIWQNVGSTFTYRNCTPAMPNNVKFFNFSTPCTYTFNVNSIPNSTTPLPNGIHFYRLKLYSSLDNPEIEYTEPTSVTICRTCLAPVGNVKLYVKTSDSLEPNGLVPIIGESSYNYGNYNLYAEILPSREGEPNNISFIDIYEKFQFIKRVNVNQPYGAFIIIDSLINKTVGGYTYSLRVFTNNASYPVGSSNSVSIKVDSRPCFPESMTVQANTLKFNLLSSCPLTKYKVLLYKLENLTTTDIDTNGNEVANVIDASNNFLTEDLVRNLNVNPTPIVRFANDEIPDFTLRFTSQEIANKIFSRIINPKPTTLNNWYRIDVVCTSCVENNIKSAYYYFKN